VVRVSACSRPLGRAGGDFYDLLPFDPDHLGIFIGDVSGHGPHVDPIANVTRALMRQQARRFGAGDPQAMLVSLNQNLFDQLPRHVFVTAIFGILHRGSGAFRFVRAGHSSPLVTRSDKVVPLSPGGMALGLDNGPLFQRSLEVERVVFREGTRVLLYTDGLVEADNDCGVHYGLERLTKSIQDHTSLHSEDQFLSAILCDWRQHLCGRAPSDDVTVIGLHHSL